jgi:hypothetical protein
MSTTEEQGQVLSVAREPNGEANEGGNRGATLAGDPVGAGNLEKIRTILFGSQMRDYEKRFMRLEERLLKVSTDLREETRRSLDALEAYVKRELETLTDRIKGEQDERTGSLNDLSRELRDTGYALEKKIAQLDEQANKVQRDLHQQLLEQSKGLSEEIRQKYEEISAVLERSLQELRVDKTDRSTLAALFTEVALRLNNEFQLPDE